MSDPTSNKLIRGRSEKNIIKRVRFDDSNLIAKKIKFGIGLKQYDITWAPVKAPNFFQVDKSSLGVIKKALNFNSHTNNKRKVLRAPGAPTKPFKRMGLSGMDRESLKKNLSLIL